MQIIIIVFKLIVKKHKDLQYSELYIPCSQTKTMRGVYWHKLKSLKVAKWSMNEEWIKNDEWWRMNEEWWRMNEEWWRMNEGWRRMKDEHLWQTFVILDLLLLLKMFGFLQDNSICNSQRVFNVSKRLIYNYLSFCILSAKIIC